MPGFGSNAGRPKHIFQFIHAVVGQSGNGLARTAVNASDGTVGQIVVMVEVVAKMLWPFASILAT